MFDAFDPSSIYELIGQPVIHLPLAGGEVSGRAVLNVPGKTLFGDGALALDPSIRYCASAFCVKPGDTFVINDEAWKVIGPATPLHDGAELIATVVRQ